MKREINIKIDKGVPMPFFNAGKFPFSEMTEVGDSFFFDVVKGCTCYVYALKWAKDNGKEWKFRYAAEGDGFRIWRVK